MRSKRARSRRSEKFCPSSLVSFSDSDVLLRTFVAHENRLQGQCTSYYDAGTLGIVIAIEETGRPYVLTTSGLGWDTEDDFVRNAEVR